MSLSIISDVHIRNSSDERHDLFLSFLRNEKVQNSESIFLLGDIFDLVVGPYEEYISEFKEVYDELSNLLKNGKRIIYVEGNHDFCFSDMYLNSSNLNGIEVLKGGTVYTHQGKRIYLSHGDDFELGNTGYKFYRRFISSNFIKLLSSEITSYKFVKWVGDYQSKKSRERGVKNYGSGEKDEQIKSNFREGAENFSKMLNVDWVIGGHSHQKDLFEMNDFKYANNGFAPAEKTFIYINNGISFETIT